MDRQKTRRYGGYQERFAEMRYKKSQITGLFRSDAPESLDAWHLSQDFETRPVLTGGFIGEDPPIDRIIAVPDEPHFLLDCYFKYNWVRPLPTYGVPGYVDTSKKKMTKTNKRNTLYTGHTHALIKQDCGGRCLCITSAKR